MDLLSVKRIEMGTRALEFSDAHPDSEPGMVTATARLKELLVRATETATAQREGLVRVRAATQEKEDLRRKMSKVHIRHLAEVGRAAAVEEPELGKMFRFRPEASTYFAFRTAARSMAQAAQEHLELLVKYGLSQSVLQEFIQLLDQLDEAILLSHEGRAEHVGATRDLKAGSFEIVRTVRVMNGRNRQRFANDPQLLGSWVSASTVLGKPRPNDQPERKPPAGGEERPAA